MIGKEQNWLEVSPLLILLLLIFFLGTATSCSIHPSPAVVSHDLALFSERVQTQHTLDILRALFLEHQHRYSEARKIWMMLPPTSSSVKDHIFQAELIDNTPLVMDSIPITASSIMLAVSYLNWRKQWADAYKLLKNRSIIVSQDEVLKLAEVKQALYLRKYEEAESILLGIIPYDSDDKLQWYLLWSWTQALSEKTSGLRSAIEKSEEFAQYLPASFYLMKDGTFDLPKMKKSFLKALTLSPSDTELTEKIILLFQYHSDWSELEILFESNNKEHWTALWKLEANLYWMTGQKEKLKRLLETVSETEKKRVAYLDFEARLAILEEEWEHLKRILDQYRKRYSYLRDGDLFLAEYQIKAKSAGLNN
ncbi:MAG: hypothetical protein HQ517_06250 [SAR324 cluster bacterium]|nr:hypothetical protein [SAR324 cluster bacterium]